MDFTEENPLSVSSVGAAVRTNNVEAVRKSIGRGRSIDLKDNRGWAAIHCAASNNFTDCLNVLLKAGADTNIRTHEGETPLFLACTSNCYEAAIILLEAECLINLPNNENVTPLHIAACKGFTRLVSLLLDKKADINAKDYDSDTPLMEAVRHEHADVCRILVSHGADQTICGSQEQLPIHMACATSNLQILRVLLHSKQYTTEYLHKVVNWIDITGYSPLMVAVRSHNLPCVEELLKSGADTKKGVCKNSCMTTLHLAAFHGNLPILKVILNATSKDAISFCDQSIRTNLICCAIDSESEECLSYLLDYGLQSEVLNSCFFEFNPIIYFLYNKFKKLRILEILLESGYDPNFENNAITVNIACILYNYLQSNRIENELAETVVHKLVDHGMYVDSYHKTDEIFQFDELSLSIKYSILGGRYRLIPYLLQRSVITEPYHVLNYILLHAQWKTTHDMSALITLLCHYVDPSNLLRTLLLRRPSGDNGSSKVEFLSHLVKFPSLKGMARSAIRKYIHIVCDRNEHQFKVKLNSLDLPADLISYLNYEGMQEFYKSLENCRQDTIPECTSL